jgi:hypothetical protein
VRQAVPKTREDCTSVSTVAAVVLRKWKRAGRLRLRALDAKSQNHITGGDFAMSVVVRVTVVRPGLLAYLIGKRVGLTVSITG